MPRVAVALSGGLDSAVTALLLKEQGRDVIGVTAKTVHSGEADIVTENAKKVADKLQIEHFTIDVSKEFDDRVIKYFVNSYKNGLTPNPCVMCNKYIKWGILHDYAINNLNADFIATGHYANVREIDGIFKLYPASDEHKDQLYFLFLLDQEKLSKTLFPLSGYKKSEVREIAYKYNLPPKSARESQDICFIKAPMTTKKYLNNLFSPVEGFFIEKKTGKILGKHNGFWQYTIGQRKGIGIAASEALYVTAIDALKNIVYVGYRDELFSDSIMLEKINWTYPQKANIFDAFVKIRYNMAEVEAVVCREKEGAVIRFKTPVSAVTKGQVCVIYDKKDKHLLGGGFI